MKIYRALFSVDVELEPSELTKEVTRGQYLSAMIIRFPAEFTQHTDEQLREETKQILRRQDAGEFTLRQIV